MFGPCLPSLVPLNGDNPILSPSIASSQLINGAPFFSEVGESRLLRTGYSPPRKPWDSNGFVTGDANTALKREARIINIRACGHCTKNSTVPDRLKRQRCVMRCGTSDNGATDRVSSGQGSAATSVAFRAGVIARTTCNLRVT